MKKIFSLLLAGLALSFTVSAKSPRTPDKDIVVLYTNDVHCGIDDSIGYAGLFLYKQEMKEQTPYVTLVDAGDAIQGATIGMLSEGGYIITLMNQVGYDVAIPGNHEFDYGMARFLDLSKKLKCGYVSSNFRNAKGKLLFPEYKMISYGKTKVAFVGVATPESITKSTPTIFMDSTGKFVYDFGGDNGGAALYKDVQNAINKARKKGADYVILVAHLGESDVKEEWSALSVIANTTGADALIDGHSHEITPSRMAKNKDGKEIPITQSGTKLKAIGKLTIKTDGTLTTELVDSVPQKNGLTFDPAIKDSVESLKNEFKTLLEKKVSHTDFDLKAFDENKKYLVRKQETNLANLITDAYRDLYKTDIAVMNGGGIRADIKAGDITENDVLTVHPFSNRLCVIEVSGQAILDELEFGLRLYPQLCGGLLHTAGVTFKVNPSIPSSAKTDDKGFFAGVDGEYRIHDVLVNGEPLDPAKTYTVAGSAYVLTQKGDGHMFNGGKLIPRNDYKLDREALRAYIEKLGNTIPEQYKDENGAGRMVFDN